MQRVTGRPWTTYVLWALAAWGGMSLLLLLSGGGGCPPCHDNLLVARETCEPCKTCEPCPLCPSPPLSPPAERAWAQSPFVVANRKQLGRWLEEAGYTGNGVEIGVKRGLFSHVILSDWKSVSKYYLVDPWEHQAKYDDIANVQQGVHNEFMEETIARLRPFATKYSIMRNYSTDIAPSFPDEFFDFVFVDARHDYRSVKEDLLTWYPKCASGGIFAGHDYLDGAIAAGDFGVKSAVDEFVLELNKKLTLARPITVNVTRDPWPSWFFMKP